MNIPNIKEKISALKNSLDDPEFREFLINNDYYDKIENFCDDLEIIFTHYNKEIHNGNKDNSPRN